MARFKLDYPEIAGQITLTVDASRFAREARIRMFIAKWFFFIGAKILKVNLVINA